MGQILFKGPMVNAILAGRKSQTRRVVDESKLRVRLVHPVRSDWPSDGIVAKPGAHKAKMNQHGAVCVAVGDEWLGVKPNEFEWLSPYGGRGDPLRVKETWRGFDLDGSTFRCEYRADGARRDIDVDAGRGWLPILQRAARQYPKWQPSIYMPIECSRLRPTLTSVRVERVREIGEEDCDAEGLFNESGLHLWHCSGQQFHPDQSCACGDNSPEEEFAELWDSINSDRGHGWDTNPRVYVLSFDPAEIAAVVSLAVGT